MSARRITQKSIHLKLDENLLVSLDDAVRDIGGGMNRNRLLNEAVRLLLDIRRRKTMADLYEDDKFYNGITQRFLRVLQ